MPRGINQARLSKFLASVEELNYDITIVNDDSGSPGWEATLNAAFLSITQNYNTSTTAFLGFVELMNDVMDQTASFFDQQKYNGETVTGVTENAGIYTGTPVYHGPFAQLMEYINQGWTSGGSSAPVAMPDHATAMTETSDFLKSMNSAQRAVALPLLESNYPALYTDILTEYIESL